MLQDMIYAVFPIAIIPLASMLFGLSAKAKELTH
jgi:hypothetical protein